MTALAAHEQSGSPENVAKVALTGLSLSNWRSRVMRSSHFARPAATVATKSRLRRVTSPWS